MGKVAIYAIALDTDPYTIRYIGSAKEPANRLCGHISGSDGADTKKWMMANASRLRCYIIEWVDEELRFVAEAYWYVYHQQLVLDNKKRLVNYRRLSLSKSTADYSPYTSFDPKTAFCFSRREGMSLEAIAKYRRMMQESAIKIEAERVAKLAKAKKKKRGKSWLTAQVAGQNE